MKKNKIELMRMHFDNHIWACFLEFLDANHVKTNDEGKRLKEGVEYDWLKTKNRNPIVPKELWEEMLWRHLNYLNYN